MSLKETYSEIKDNELCKLLSLTLDNSEETIKIFSNIEKETQGFSEQDWRKLVDVMRKSKNHFALCGILLETAPKDIAFNLAKTIPYDYLLLKRGDLNMDDIKEIVKIIKPKRLKETIANNNIEINYKNIEYLCKLSPSTLKKMDFEPLSMINEDLPIYFNIEGKINSGECDENFCTAIINNKKINTEIREKAFAIAYNPTNLRHITRDMADKLYPELASIAFQETQEIDLSFRNVLNETFIRLIKNGEFSKSHYIDFVERYKKDKYISMESSLDFLAKNIVDSEILQNIQTCFGTYAQETVTKNPAYDINVLESIGKNWIYANSDSIKDVVSFEKKIVLMRSMLVLFAEKPIVAKYHSYLISPHKDDNVFIKTLLMSPSVALDLKSDIIKDKKTNKERMELRCLAKISMYMKDIGIDPCIHQFFSYQILNQLFKEDETVSKLMINRKETGDYNTPITYNEFKTTHKEINKMNFQLTHSNVANLRKLTENINKEFPEQVEILNALNKAYKMIEEEKMFDIYISKWSQFYCSLSVKERFYGDKTHTGINMKVLNMLKTQPTLLKMFTESTIETCQKSAYFSEKLYNMINVEFINLAQKTEDTKLLLENMRILEPMYHQIEDIVMENRFNNKEISKAEYNFYKLRFPSSELEIDKNDEER